MTESRESAHRGDMPTPPVLYKYYAFNEWTAGIFERNEIYFQSPDGFNDPFDSKIATTYEGNDDERVSRVIQAWRGGPAKDKTEKDLRPQALEFIKNCHDVALMLRTGERSADRIRERLGIFCMTGEKDNLLMWSHYAAEHTQGSAWDLRPDTSSLRVRTPSNMCKTAPVSI
jgi:hypothetical protein